MITLAGHYFDGVQPVNVPARMDFTEQEAVLTTESLVRCYPILNLLVSPRSGSTARFVTLPDAGQFACPDHPSLDRLPQESPAEGPVAWLEARWIVAIACVAVIVCTSLAGYFFGLPAAAKAISLRIPIATEQSLGSQALTWLDEKRWLRKTKLDDPSLTGIRNGFYGLLRDLPLRDYYRLEFRAAKFGPNAFAFPGGIIIITDDLVKTAETREEILAVLAHEIGHIELRHTMRSLLQNSVIAAATAALTSDAASLSVAIAGLPVLLTQAKYSRELEAEADEYAFRLLKRKGYSPAAFAAIMERIAAKDEEETGSFAYISSHPLATERAARARQAARE